MISFQSVTLQLGLKPLFITKIMISYRIVPANSVPAAAVIQKGRVLFIITGRKEFVGG